MSTDWAGEERRISIDHPSIQTLKSHELQNDVWRCKLNKEKNSIKI
jgi:hypothetical protein